MQFIARRRRWWTVLEELDSSISLIANLLGGMLLDQACLSTVAKNMTIISTQNNYELDLIGQALLDQHWDLYSSQSQAPSAGIHRPNRWTRARPSPAHASLRDDHTYADENGEDYCDAYADCEE